MIETKINSNIVSSSKTVMSTNELWYLINLYAPTSVIGIENPYFGRFSYEIEVEEQKAFDSLNSQNYISKIDKDSMEITNLSLKKVVETCLNPKSCFWFSTSQGLQPNMVIRHTLYFSDTQNVLIQDSGDHNCSLISFNDSQEVITQIFDTIFPSLHDGCASSEFTLEEPNFDSIINSLNSNESLIENQNLVPVGLNELSIKELRSALGENGLIILTYKINNPKQPDQCHIQASGYIAGEFGGWTIKQFKENESDFIRFQPETINQFKDSLISMVQ